MALDTSVDKILRKHEVHIAHPGRRGSARVRDLKRLLPLYAYDVTDKSRERLLQLTAALRKALRQERLRGIAGDWTYSLQRHKALLARYRCEIERLRSVQPQATAQKPSRMRKAD